MDIIIQSLGFKASENLETFIKERLEKIEQGNDKIVRANVTLFKGSGTNNDSYCEIRLEVPGNDPFVKKSNEVFETAIVEAVDTLQKMLRKSRDKEVDRRHANL